MSEGPQVRVERRADADYRSGASHIIVYIEARSGPRSAAWWRRYKILQLTFVTAASVGFINYSELDSFLGFIVFLGGSTGVTLLLSILYFNLRHAQHPARQLAVRSDALEIDGIRIPRSELRSVRLVPSGENDADVDAQLPSARWYELSVQTHDGKHLVVPALKVDARSRLHELFVAEGLLADD